MLEFGLGYGALVLGTSSTFTYILFLKYPTPSTTARNFN